MIINFNSLYKKVILSSETKMDCLLMIDQDGKLYYAEAPDITIYKINDENIYSEIKTINRISNGRWCCWGINNEFEIFLYVFGVNYN